MAHRPCPGSGSNTERRRARAPDWRVRVTAAREKIVDFATYLTDGQALLAPSDSTLSSVTAITQLCGLTVGTGAGTTFQTILTKNAGACAAA